MASKTGFVSNKTPYVDKDLNTIFAPITQVDYGTFSVNGTSPNIIGEGWCAFVYINKDEASAGNVIITTANNSYNGLAGFKIIKTGIYKMSISLIFGGLIAENYQPMAFILNSSITPIVGDSYEFTPCPLLTDVYSFGGLSTAGTGTFTNRNNQVQKSNQLYVNLTGGSYMFAFETASNNSNIATFEITFKGSENQTMYPQIRCNGGANPKTQLKSGNWLFSKL